ncbi:neuronal acetylcholine receptor subunit alpha-10-like [Amphiura filiformis]|uniref:neuronal acetylcholine receptor subunit alpha-10-like n=1 Tax=Amphiura filiformis TaxID=82378 RepID=UPI003B21A606
MEPKLPQILLVFTSLLLSEVVKGSNESKRLIKDLFETDSYSKLVRPVINESTPVLVTFELYLASINDVNEKFQTITTMVWLTQRWTDEYLMWDPQKYNNISTFRIPSTMLWLPDTVLYNKRSGDNAQLMKTETLMIVNSDGSVDWSAPLTFVSQCKINVYYYPFDTQKCDMVFGSWQHDARYIDYPIHEADASEQEPNGEWETLGMVGLRKANEFSCCPGKVYPDLTFTLRIRRKPLFYVVNLVIPCALISAMSMVEFILPCNSGEKVSLGITVLLSLTVFMLVVAENMPATSDDIPILARYYITTIFLVSFSTFMTVLVLNLHHRRYPMPKWMKEIFLGVLAQVLCINVDKKRRGAGTYNIGLPSRGHHIELMPTASGTAAEMEFMLKQEELSATGPGHGHGHNHSHQNNAPINSRTGPITWKDRIHLEILNNIRYLAGRYAEKAHEEQTINEWQGVAKVMDRFFLCIYVVCVVVMDGVMGMQILRKDPDHPS